MSKAAKPQKIHHRVTEILDDAKAHDIAVLDVRKISDFTDYMIIATGTSPRHVQSSADKVVDAMREQGLRPVGVEGRQIGDWVLIDFGDVVVHVMREQTRDFYNIEKLWSDAKRVKSVAGPKKGRRTAVASRHKPAKRAS